MKKLTLIQNTIILVLSNLITGSLSFIFSIVVSKKLGAQGMGLYCMVMPVYSLFICMTCGGATTAISKIVAELNSKNKTTELFKTIKASLSFFMFWTVCIALVALFISPIISKNILKDSRTYLAILTIIPAVILVSGGAILKGYFYGLQNSIFPAIIDILEKLIRITVLLILLNYLKNYSLNYQIAGATLAMTAGEISSTLFLYLAYKKTCSANKAINDSSDNVLQIIINILKISFPLCINGLLSTIMYTIISAMIPLRLEHAGFSAETSLALFGKLSGMSLSIVMFPSIIIGAISIILVPAISEANINKKSAGIERKVFSTIKLTIFIAAASCGIFLSIPMEIGKLFYSRNDLGNIIYSLSFGLIFVYIESTLLGILNGLGGQRALLKNTIIMSIIDIIVLYVLVGKPNINIYGYGINFVISPLVGCILNTIEINKASSINFNPFKFIPIPIVCTLIEIFYMKNIKIYAYTAFKNMSSATISLILSGIIVYTFTYILFKRLKHFLVNK